MNDLKVTAADVTQMMMCNNNLIPVPQTVLSPTFSVLNYHFTVITQYMLAMLIDFEPNIKATPKVLISGWVPTPMKHCE